MLGFEQGDHGAFGVEDAVRVFEADDLVVLDEVDVVDAEAAEALVDLAGGFLFGAAVDLGHEEGFVAVAVLEGLADAELAASRVVVPGVVEEVDAAVERGADDADAEFFGDGGEAEVPSADADGGDAFRRCCRGCGIAFLGCSCAAWMQEKATASYRPGALEDFFDFFFERRQRGRGGGRHN